MLRLVASLSLALLATSCVERERVLTRAERRQLAEFVSTTRPTPAHPLEVRFSGGLELIGYDVDVTTWGVGAEATFTFYWHAAEDMDEGWRAFTHVCDATGNMQTGADDRGMVRTLYPVGRFRRGEYVRDVQKITLPATFDKPEAVVYVGAFNDEGRMGIVRGPNDGQNRARVVTLPTGATGPAAAPNRPLDIPRLVVRRTTAPITLDGNLDEPDWGRAARTAPFVETLTGAPSSLRGSVRVLWDDTHIYFGFEATDVFLASPFTERDQHLWEKDCVELMLDPGGDGRNYFEMQVNPLGTVFDTRYDSRRVPQPFGRVDFDSMMRNGVVVRGTPNDSLDDEGYVVELSMPFSAFAVGIPPVTTPTAGEIWRANFYILDAMRSGSRASAWSAPRIGDFHFPPRFGELFFEGAQ